MKLGVLIIKPNIVYIHSHDTGRYVQPYGHAIPTPAIQKLADQGVFFRRAFSAAPTCSPSRAALLTGQVPHSSGMLGLAHRGFSLADSRQHLAHTLKSVGYDTVLAGVQHVSDDSESIGYTKNLKPSSTKAVDIAGTAANFLRRTSNRPFFLDVGFFETHLPFPELGLTEDERYCLPPEPLPDAPEIRSDMVGFKASACLLDEGIGVVLDALQASGKAEETLVICTTDHGIALPGMKCSLTDHGIGVMLIMRGPSVFHGGSVWDGMVSQIDLFPTLCDFLGIARPCWLTGNSLLPMLNGNVEEINDAVFAEVTYHAAYEPQRAMRTARWKYIRRFEPRNGPVLPNCDDSASKEYLLNNGWRERPLETEQLYDLVFDPNESANIIGQTGNAAVADTMRTRLEEWMRETNDPLLKGSVSAPAGALVSDVDALSPRETPKLIE